MRMSASSMPRRRGSRATGAGVSACATVIPVPVPALVMSGTYPNGVVCAASGSAPARRGADVVDVPRRPPGPGAVREEVPQRVALHPGAGRLAVDGDDLAPAGVPDDVRTTTRRGAQR